MLPFASFVNIEESPAGMGIHLDQPSSISRQQGLHMEPEMHDKVKETVDYLDKPSYVGVGVLDRYTKCNLIVTRR